MLNMDTLKLITFINALFANNTDLSSQISYIIVLIDNCKGTCRQKAIRREHGIR